MDHGRFIFRRIYRVGLSIGLLLLLGTLMCLPRAAAMDILVVSSADSGNGTLRQAIQFNESLGGGNRIVFSNTITGTILLTNLAGELSIGKDVTIVGPGVNKLAIDANHAHRLFHMTNGVVTIFELTLTNGYSGADENGGGILEDGGFLTCSNCLITGNYSVFSGGAFCIGSGSARLIGCTVSGNRADGSPLSDGGGILFGSAGSLDLVSCTFAGNDGAEDGGGLAVSVGTVRLTNCTFSGNSNYRFGGGIRVFSGTVFVRNSIVAGNVSGSRTDGQDCYGAFISGGFNLIGKVDGSTGWGSLGDQFGTTNAPLDAMLGPLRDNGGPMPTIAPFADPLAPSSPALDQGNSSGLTTDQRGRPRPHTSSFISSIPFGGDRADIGAVEISPISLVVSNANDNGAGSLRQTILSDPAPDGDNIQFAPAVVGTIVLTNGELVLSNSLNILGPGPKLLAISGNHNSRVFHVRNGRTLLSNLTITGGTNNITPVDNAGGGILSEATSALTVSNCIVTDNSARNLGGGIAARGSLAVYNSTIVSNTAFGSGIAGANGGGIYAVVDSWIQNCTITRNTAFGGFVTLGGGVCGLDAGILGVNLSYCTVISNSANTGGTVVGGGVYNGGGCYLYLYDTIAADNTGGSAPDVDGNFLGTFNLIGKSDGSTGLTNGVNHNLVGSSATPLEPRLGPLRDNGGPTPTCALAPDSPALDRGNALFSENTDQRGAPRPFILPFVNQTNASDGSDIGAFELAMPTLAIRRSGTNAILSWPAYYGDFRPQSATNLPASNNWTTIATIPVVAGNTLTVTSGPVAGIKYFRLKNN